MGYFNYHGKLKKLIEENHLLSVELVDNWNGIKPAMVFYFDNNIPMPVREHRFQEYKNILAEKNIKIKIKLIKVKLKNYNI